MKRLLLIGSFLFIIAGCSSQGAINVTLGTGTDSEGITEETDVFQPGESIWMEITEKSSLGKSIDLQLRVQQSDEIVHRGVIDVNPGDKPVQYELPLNLVEGKYQLQLQQGGELKAEKTFTVQTRITPEYEIQQKADREDGVVDLLVVTPSSTPVELAAILHDLQSSRDHGEAFWVQFHEPSAGAYGSLKASAAIAKSEEGASRIGASHPMEYLLEMKR